MHELIKTKCVSIIDNSKIAVGDVVKVTFKESEVTRSRRWFYRREDVTQRKYQAYAIVRDVYEDKIAVLMAEFQNENKDSHNRFDRYRDFEITVRNLSLGAYDVEIVLKRDSLQEG